MFNVWINDGTTEMPDDEILYIISKEGILLKKKVGIVESCIPVDKISTLESMSSFARLDIPQIPHAAVQAIVGFFKEVYKEYKAEAIVLLYYNRDTGAYRIVSPEQEVSGGSVNYTNNLEGIPGYDLVGTIHSHAGMGAFHSGTDDADEASFDGLHITFGSMNSDIISISSSVVVNGKRFKVDAEEYLENVDIDTYEEEVEVKSAYPSYSNRHLFAPTVQNGKTILNPVTPSQLKKTVTKSKLGFKVEAGNFPESWMDSVSQKVWTPTHSVGFNRGVGGSTISPFYRRGLGNSWFNRSLLDDEEETSRIPGKSDAYDYGYMDNWWDLPTGSNLSVLRDDDEEIDFGETSPCKGCMYRHFKSDLEFKDLMDIVEDGDEG